MPDEPEGQVKVRARQGPVEDLALIDLREERIALRETDVVLEELPLSFRTLEFDTNTNRGSGGIESLLNNGLDNAMMDMRHIGRRSVTV